MDPPETVAKIARGADNVQRIRCNGSENEESDESVLVEHDTLSVWNECDEWLLRLIRAQPS